MGPVSPSRRSRSYPTVDCLPYEKSRSRHGGPAKALPQVRPDDSARAPGPTDSSLQTVFSSIDLVKVVECFVKKRVPRLRNFHSIAFAKGWVAAQDRPLA